MDSFKISKEQYCDLMKLDRTNAVNLFVYLLANADDNGTLIVSIRKISSELDIGLRTVRTVLKKLYAANIVTHQVTHQMKRWKHGNTHLAKSLFRILSNTEKLLFGSSSTSGPNITRTARR